MFVKMSLRDQLDCLVVFAGMIFLCLLPPFSLRLASPNGFLRVICIADFVGKTLLTIRFLLPVPNCFLEVCPPTIFAAVLIFFLPLTTSAISGTESSDKSAPTCFAAGTLYLRKNGIVVLPITCARAPYPLPFCFPTPLCYGISTCLEATIL